MCFEVEKKIPCAQNTVQSSYLMWNEGNLMTDLVFLITNKFKLCFMHVFNFNLIIQNFPFMFSELMYKLYTGKYVAHYYC